METFTKSARFPIYFGKEDHEAKKRILALKRQIKEEQAAIIKRANDDERMRAVNLIVKGTGVPPTFEINESSGYTMCTYGVRVLTEVDGQKAKPANKIAPRPLRPCPAVDPKLTNILMHSNLLTGDQKREFLARLSPALDEILNPTAQSDYDLGVIAGLAFAKAEAAEVSEGGGYFGDGQADTTDSIYRQGAGEVADRIGTEIAELQEKAKP